MTIYKLAYITTRDINGTNVPATEFPEPVILDYQYNNYNEADRMRCELCEKMHFGYVRIIEEDL